jgi:hypothetical protein
VVFASHKATQPTGLVSQGKRFATWPVRFDSAPVDQPNITMQRKRHIVIPDTQIRPGSPTEHLTWIARFIADHREPDHMQIMGDWWDMPSLNSWSKKGSLDHEGRRIQDDRDAGYRAMEDFVAELMGHGALPESIGFCMGNHEERLDRTLKDDPRLIDLIDRDTFYGLQDFPIKVAEFMAPMHYDGVTYCHLFDINAQGDTTGRRSGQTCAAAQAARVRGSSVAGHKQGYSVAHRTHPYALPWERETFAVIAGSCYLHKEDYRGPTDGYEKRGIVVIDDLNGWGMGSPRFVSMEYLKENYG